MQLVTAQGLGRSGARQKRVSKGRMRQTSVFTVAAPTRHLYSSVSSLGSPIETRKSGRSSVFSLFNLKEKSRFWSEDVIHNDFDDLKFSSHGKLSAFNYTNAGLWWESMSWNQMVGPIASSPAAHFIQFCEGFAVGQNQSCRYGWWVALTNSIWKHRNQLVFEGNHFLPSKVMEDALFLNWSWLKTREKHFSISFNQWSSNLVAYFSNIANYLKLQEVDSIHLPVPMNFIFIGFEGKGSHEFKLLPEEIERWFTKIDHVFEHTRIRHEEVLIPFYKTNMDKMRWHHLPVVSHINYNFSVHAIEMGEKVTSIIEHAINVFGRKDDPVGSRLPTRYNLLKRNVSIPDQTCPLCRSHQEEAGHLFFHCKVTTVLWWEYMSWIKMAGPLAASPADHFIQFCDGFGTAINQTRRRCWWIALTSTIWQHRNSLVFQGKSFDPPKVMEDSLFLLDNNSGGWQVDVDMLDGLLSSLVEYLQLENAYNIFILNPKRDEKKPKYGYRRGLSEPEINLLKENKSLQMKLLQPEGIPENILALTKIQRPLYLKHPMMKFSWTRTEDTDIIEWYNIWLDALDNFGRLYQGRDTAEIIEVKALQLLKGKDQDLKLHLEKVLKSGDYSGFQAECLTDTWIGKDRWAFIDLSAGPFSWGPAVGGEGVRTEASLPSVEKTIGSASEISEEEAEDRLQDAIQEKFAVFGDKEHQAIDILLAEIDIYELFAFKHCKGRKVKLALCEELDERMRDLRNELQSFEGEEYDESHKKKAIEALKRMESWNLFSDTYEEFQNYTVARDSFLAHLGATLWGSMRHIVSPSVADGAFHYYEKISFQLFFMTQEKVRHIKQLPVDMKAIMDGFSSLMVPSQKPMFSPHVLPLSEDPALAMAFAVARRAAAVPLLLINGTYRKTVRTYLDSSILQYQLQRLNKHGSLKASLDFNFLEIIGMLTVSNTDWNRLARNSGLKPRQKGLILLLPKQKLKRSNTSITIGNGDVSGRNLRFSEKMKKTTPFENKFNLLTPKEIIGIFSYFGHDSEIWRRIWSLITIIGLAILAQGRHVHSRSVLEVPVFWFIYSEPLLLDKYFQAKALSDMIIVVQSEPSSWESHLHCNGHSLLLNLRQPIKAAVAATAEHLAGLLPLHLVYGQAHETAIEDWLWSVGCNPFSITSQGWHLSQFQSDSIARSYVITTLEESIQLVNSAIHLLLMERTTSNVCGCSLLNIITMCDKIANGGTLTCGLEHELVNKYNYVVSLWKRVSTVTGELRYSDALRLLNTLEDASKRFVDQVNVTHALLHPINCTRERKIHMVFDMTTIPAFLIVLGCLYMVLRPRRPKPKIN
ncbi:hypothetical protein HKD37_01G000003 [Glycine soja]